MCLLQAEQLCMNRNRMASFELLFNYTITVFIPEGMKGRATKARSKFVNQSTTQIMAIIIIDYSFTVPSPHLLVDIFCNEQQDGLFFFTDESDKHSCCIQSDRAHCLHCMWCEGYFQVHVANLSTHIFLFFFVKKN